MSDRSTSMGRNVGISPLDPCSGLQHVCPLIPRLFRAQRLSCSLSLYFLCLPCSHSHPVPSLASIFSNFSPTPPASSPVSHSTPFKSPSPHCSPQPIRSTSHHNICKLGVPSSSQDTSVRKGFGHNSYTHTQKDLFDEPQ